MATRVVNLRHERFTTYIGRGSKWGNKFVIGIHGDRDEVCDKYEAWVVQQPELMLAISELKDKVLGCYCVPQRYHGNFLVWLADHA